MNLPESLFESEGAAEASAFGAAAKASAFGVAELVKSMDVLALYDDLARTALPSTSNRQLLCEGASELSDMIGNYFQ